MPRGPAAHGSSSVVAHANALIASHKDCEQPARVCHCMSVSDGAGGVLARRSESSLDSAATSFASSSRPSITSRPGASTASSGADPAADVRAEEAALRAELDAELGAQRGDGGVRARDQLGPELEPLPVGDALGDGADAAADPVARLEHGHLQTGVVEPARRGQTGDPGADDRDAAARRHRATDTGRGTRFVAAIVRGSP